MPRTAATIMRSFYYMVTPLRRRWCKRPASGGLISSPMMLGPGRGRAKPGAHPFPQWGRRCGRGSPLVPPRSERASACRSRESTPRSWRPRLAGLGGEAPLAMTRSLTSAPAQRISTASQSYRAESPSLRPSPRTRLVKGMPAVDVEFGFVEESGLHEARAYIHTQR